MEENNIGAIFQKEESVTEAPEIEQEQQSHSHSRIKVSADRQFSIEESSSKNSKGLKSTPWVLFKGLNIKILLIKTSHLQDKHH